MNKEKIKEIAFKIKELIGKGDVSSIIRYVEEMTAEVKTPKMKITPLPYLYSIGREVAKIMQNEKLPQDFIKNWWIRSYESKKTYFYGIMEGRESRHIVIGYLSGLLEKRADDVLKFIIKLSEYFYDWETVDTFCLRIVCPLVQKDWQLMVSIFEDWLTSDNPWTRRIPLVVIPLLLRKEGKCRDFYSDILKIMSQDRTKPVRKAWRWAHREVEKYCKKD